MRPLEITSIVARRLASPTGWWKYRAHARAEQDRRRRRGDEGQALERVGDRQIRRELDLADPRARVERDVLGHVERLENPRSSAWRAVAFRFAWSAPAKPVL
jgi:hypothetical protein